MRALKLAIVSTHPIQYYAPVFRGLASVAQLNPRVFYTWSQAQHGSLKDAEFGRTLQWDVPLLEGYEHEFVPNVAARPGPDHFFGIRNPALIRRIEGWGADAVLVYAWNFASHLAAMRHFAGRMPVFFRGDSTLLDPLPAPRRMLRRTLLTTVYRAVDVAIAVGSNSRDYFEWCGIAPQDIEVAPHSVDTRRFAADDNSRAAHTSAWRAQLGIAPDARVFAFAGKFIAKKDPLLLMDAFERVSAPAHLVLFGSGAMQAQLQARAAAHPRMHVLPFQNQAAMPLAYRLGDVFVLPSRGPGETWGLALNEAMACGRAVIASSRVGGARDLIIPGITGWQFAAGDVDGLAQILNTCALMPRERLRNIGAAAAQRAEQWSTEACVARLSEILLRRSAPASLLRSLRASSAVREAVE
jgi:glycosyltransferase involved in cell wall biosynthesis